MALLKKQSLGGVPLMGKLAPGAELHARDFETLLDRVERGEGVLTGARHLSDPSEIAMIRARTSADPAYRPPSPCPSGLSNDELLQQLQELDGDI